MFQFNKLIIVLFGIHMGFANAQNNLPEVSGIKNVGRVLAFPTVKRNIWFSPTAFTSKLTCSSSVNSYCSLRIFNMISENEYKELNQLTKEGQVLLFFNDIDARAVSGVKDQFINLSSSFDSGQFMLLGTLAQSDASPYALAQTKVARSDAQILQELYATTGIGTFETSFHLNGEWTEDFIEVESNVVLEKTLKQISLQPQSLPEIKSKLISALKKSPIKMKNFTEDEAVILAYRFIVMNYIVGAGFGAYTITNFTLSNIPKSIVVVNESHLQGMNCKVQLQLKDGAVSSTMCSEGLL